MIVRHGICAIYAGIYTVYDVQLMHGHGLWFGSEQVLTLDSKSLPKKFHHVLMNLETWWHECKVIEDKFVSY